ncbi:MAG: DUF134 domain-containing protein [Candidatus Heimdallarchaeota archaeon]|nr:DUF134 domain-containing protein [Candidatus Heimdallarchaeota archaeon]
MRNYRCRKGRRYRGKMQRYEEEEETMRGRPRKEIIINKLPNIEKVIPQPILSNEEIILTLAEYEALRLVDLEGLNQTEAGELMEISRGTIWRLLDSGRKKLMEVMIEGKPLVLEKFEQRDKTE